MTTLPMRYSPGGTRTSPPDTAFAAASSAFWKAAVSLVVPSPVAPEARTSNRSSIGGDDGWDWQPTQMQTRSAVSKVLFMVVAPDQSQVEKFSCFTDHLPSAGKPGAFASGP